MKSYKSLLLLCLVPVLALASCYHQFGTTTCTTNCTTSGTGSVVVTVTATPSQTFYFPYLAWAITSITLTNNSGGSVLILQGALPITDFARLQSDSQFLNIAKTVAAGSYTKATITMSPSTNPDYVYNSTTANLFSGTNTCVPGAVCAIPSSVPGFGHTTVTVPVTFSVAANQSTGFSLNFDLSKAVTTTGGLTFDFTQTGAITLATLPRTGQVSGSLDLLDNFTGTITAITSGTNSTTISMSSLSSDTRTITVPSSAEFDDPFTVCGTGQANLNCLKTNQNVSVDAVVDSDGTLTAYEVDFLDPAPGANETEGIIVTPVSNNQFKMLVTNATSITGFLPGTLATVTVNGASTYFVDPKNLGTTVSTTPTGFLSSTNLVVGQTVMLKGGAIDFTTNGLSNYTQTLLRYSTISGTVQTTGNPFTLSGLSPFFASSTTNTVQGMTFPLTTYDNTIGIPSTATNVSVRGLYLDPNSSVQSPLLAAKVRAH